MSPGKSLADHQFAVLEPVNPHRLRRRVDQPVLRHAVLRVEERACSPGPARRWPERGSRPPGRAHPARCRRRSADARVPSRRTAGPAARHRCRTARRRTERKRTLPARALERIGPAALPPDLDPLVLQVRRRGHDQISIQQLVALVRRRRSVVLVGELEHALCSNHGCFPGIDSRATGARPSPGRTQAARYRRTRLPAPPIAPAANRDGSRRPWPPDGSISQPSRAPLSMYSRILSWSGAKPSLGERSSTTKSGQRGMNFPNRPLDAQLPVEPAEFEEPLVREAQCRRQPAAQTPSCATPPGTTTTGPGVGCRAARAGWPAPPANAACRAWRSTPCRARPGPAPGSA